MANFAIAADENVIARGNKLIEELEKIIKKIQPLFLTVEFFFSNE